MEGGREGGRGEGGGAEKIEIAKFLPVSHFHSHQR